MNREETCDVWFDVYSEDFGKWMPTKFKARCSTQPGGSKIYKLFRTGVLAKVLHRTNRTIKLWEASGKLPKPRFAFENDTIEQNLGGGENRWYSEEQIRMMSCHQRGILGDNPRTSMSGKINSTPFFQAVREDWNLDSFDPDDYQYEFEEVVKGTGNVHF